MSSADVKIKKLLMQRSTLYKGIEAPVLNEISKIALSLSLEHAGVIFDLDEFDVEVIRPGRILLQGIAANQRTQHLLIVGVYENGRFQTVSSRE